MAFKGLNSFVIALEKTEELVCIKPFVDPILEVTEISDRVTKSDGKALLFENTGTKFAVLINAYGSDRRMSMAIGRKNLNEAGTEIENILKNVSDNSETFLKKLSSLPTLIKLTSILPSKLGRRGKNNASRPGQGPCQRDPEHQSTRAFRWKTGQGAQ